MRFAFEVSLNAKGNSDHLLLTQFLGIAGDIEHNLNKRFTFDNLLLESSEGLDRSKKDVNKFVEETYKQVV